MQGAINDAVLNANPLMCLLNPEEVQFLTLHIRRTHIVQDTIDQIRHGTNLKKPLKVGFNMCL